MREITGVISLSLSPLHLQSTKYKLAVQQPHISHLVNLSHIIYTEFQKISPITPTAFLQEIHT